MSSLFKRVTLDKEYSGIKLIVFDFDGTLADTRELLLRIIKKHLFTFEIYLTKDSLRFFGNTPLENYLTLTGLPSDIVRNVSDAIIEDFTKEHHKIKPCKNLLSVKKIELKKVIVSNNVTSFIKKSLEFLRVKFFDEVYGADKFNNKISMIKRLAKKYSLSPSEIVYVGDKDIDADVSRGVGCYGVIISRKSSWSKRRDILKKRPDYIISDLGKLSYILDQIDSKQLSTV